MRTLVRITCAIALIIGVIGMLIGPLELLFGDGAEKYQGAIIFGSALFVVLTAGVAYVLMDVADAIAPETRAAVDKVSITPRSQE